MSSRVTLEGKSRLPNRIQDLILDFGAVISNIQNTSGSNETLATTMKNFVAMDPLLDNSMQNLEKIEKLIERLGAQSGSLNQSIAEISEVQEKLQCMERESYFSNEPEPKPNNH